MPAGYYAVEGSAKATPCLSDAASYCPEGSSLPVPVGAGNYSARNATVQLVCEPGHYCLHGQRHRCPEGTYTKPGTILNSRAACHKCAGAAMTSLMSSSGHHSCVCQRGYFSPSTHLIGLVECRPCSQGFDCSHSNTTTASLILKHGYWRPSMHALNASKCPISKTCAGGHTSAPSYEPWSDSTCSNGSGTSGPYCMSCRAQHGSTFFLDLEARACVECSTALIITLATFGGLSQRDIQYIR